MTHLRVQGLTRPDAQAVSRLDVHFCYWLRRAANQVSHALGHKLEDKGITLAEWVVLRELYDGDLRPVILADKLGLTRGAISKLARRLERNLMITQHPSSHSRQAQILAITDGGRIMVRVLASALDETDEEFFGDLNPATRALILSTLREVSHRRGSRAAPMVD
ncbi:MAG TPA: MarR family winged helix-turn-helix transcriptional regulator [Steroidobacteraceae bacterium]|nr:MarR family winged helix-turn-helix transcriptional regulator [Steroidobacteraceae bacterium]